MIEPQRSHDRAAAQPRAVRLALRVWRIGMRMLPARFRLRHGVAAEALVARLAADAWRRAGARALGRVVARALTDVALVAIRERLSDRGRARKENGQHMAHLIPARHDVRQAWRALSRRPGLSLSVIATLGLAMSCVVAMAAVMDGVLIRPLPYVEADRLYRLLATYEGGKAPAWVSYEDFHDYRESSAHLRESAILREWTAVVAGDAGATRESGAQVSHGLFELLGVRMALGRGFRPEEQRAGRDRVVVLGHGLWRRVFGGDPRAIGSEIEVGGERYEVVGVLPERFGSGLPGLVRADIWKPIGLEQAPAGTLPGRGNEIFKAIVRLPEGVPPERVTAELRPVATGIARRFPETNEGQGVRLHGLRELAVGDAHAALVAFLGAVLLVLALAIANVSGLMLARGRDRAPELALRAALGADLPRKLHPIIAESALLALGGGMLGVLGASAGLRWLSIAGSSLIPLATEVRLDARVVAVTFGLIVFCCVCIGVMTAAGSRGVGVGLLQSFGRGVGNHRRSSLRTLLTGGQVALSIVLVSGAALLLRSAALLSQVPPGFDPGALVVRVDLPVTLYDTRARIEAFFGELLLRVSSVPGVRVAGTISWTPFSGESVCGSLFAEDDPERFRGRDMCAEVRAATAGYFDAMGIRLLRGRMFDDRDHADALDVVLVSETTARTLWPDGDAIGRRVETGFGRMHEVIGIVADVRQQGLNEDAVPQTYLPAAQWAQRSRAVVVGGAVTAPVLIAHMRSIVRDLDDGVPLSAFGTMGESVDASLAQPRFRGQLLAGFAGIALLLSLVGVHGTLAFIVNSRRREIAVRTSVGARPLAVVRLVLRDAMRMAVPGVAAGIAGALLFARLLRDLLFGVSPTDPTVLAAVAFSVLCAALLACVIPAARAMRLDPMQILREE